MSPPDAPSPPQSTADEVVSYHHDDHNVTITNRRVIVAHEAARIQDIRHAEIGDGREVFGGLVAGAIGTLLLASLSWASIFGIMFLIYAWDALTARECFTVRIEYREEGPYTLFERKKRSEWRPYGGAERRYTKNVAKAIVGAINESMVNYWKEHDLRQGLDLRAGLNLKGSGSGEPETPAAN